MYTASWTAVTHRRQSGKGYVQELTDKLAELGVGKIATVMGRYYAMDRDNRWDRVERAYNAITKGLGVSAESGVAAVQNSYNNGKNDEFVEPAVVMERRQTGSNRSGRRFRDLLQLPSGPCKRDHQSLL